MRYGALGALFAVCALGCSKSNGNDAGLVGELTQDLGLSKASGHVASTGPTGTWTLDSGECRSGDDDGFFGVFIKSNTDKRVWVKLVKDPTKGWNVGVSNPDTCKATASGGEQCDVRYFDSQDCATLDTTAIQSYAFKGKSSAGKHQFDGSVTFDCSGKDKAHVSGTLKLEKCSP